MERRDLLKRGVATVTALVGGALAGPEQAEAAAPRLAFLEGTLEGDAYSSWTFWLCITGNRAQGLVFDPTTVGGEPDEFRALRLEGRLNSRLEMTVYAWRDVNHTTPIGRLQGRIRQQVLTGTLRRPGRGDGAKGLLRATVIPLSERRTRRLAGAYAGTSHRQEGRVLYTGDLLLREDFTWEVRRIKAAKGLPMLDGLPGRRLSGRYAVAEDGRLLLSMTRVPVSLRRAKSRGKGPTIQAVSFADTEFPNGNWTVAKLRDQSPATTVDAHQEANGGNPGAYRRIRYTATGGGDLDVAHLHREFRYDPAASGAIQQIGYAYTLQSQTYNSTPFALLLRQNNTYYVGPNDHVAYAVWQQFGEPRLSAGQFRKYVGSGPGPDQPDFSASGGVIRFGFLASFYFGSSEPQTAISGIDNYQVTVTPRGGQDGPSVMLTGVHAANVLELLTLGAQVSNGPLAAQQVQLTITAPSGSEETLPVATTNESGQATFGEVSFAAEGAYHLTVRWDLDGDGEFEGIEPFDRTSIRISAAPPDPGFVCDCTPFCTPVGVGDGDDTTGLKAATAGAEIMVAHPFFGIIGSARRLPDR